MSTERAVVLVLVFQTPLVKAGRELLEAACAKVASSSKAYEDIAGVRQPAMTMPPRKRLVAAVPREVEPVQKP